MKDLTPRNIAYAAFVMAAGVSLGTLALFAFIYLVSMVQ